MLPGVPIASQCGTKSKVAHKWAGWLHKPSHLRSSHHFTEGDKIRVRHKWARWLHNPFRLGVPHHFKARDKITGGPQVGRVAT